MPSVTPRHICGMESSLVWSEELVFRLIHLYRQQRHLWDPKHEEYKNRTARIETLTAMADALQVDRRELERKLKNVTCHYYKEKRKEKTKKTGSGQYRSKWFAYQHLHFLKNKKTPSESDDTSQNPDPLECEWRAESPGSAQTSNEEVDQTHSEKVSSIPWMSFPSTNGSGSAVTVTRITKKRPLSHPPAKVPKLDNSLNTTVHSKPRRQSYDQQQPASYEFAIFGQHVASQLEALPLEEAVQLQAVIQNLITDTRLRCLRSPQSQVRSPDSRHCSEDVLLDQDFSESEDLPGT